MKNYRIACTRNAAVLYLAAEYGVSHARKLLQTIKPCQRWGVLLPEKYRRKKDARKNISRIAEFVAYQQGRLHQPLSWTGLRIINN